MKISQLHRTSALADALYAGRKSSQFVRIIPCSKGPQGQPLSCILTGLAICAIAPVVPSSAAAVPINFVRVAFMFYSLEERTGYYQHRMKVNFLLPVL